VAPEVFWLSGLLSVMTFPLICAGIIWLIIVIFLYPKLIFWPLASLVVLISFIDSTVKLGLFGRSEYDKNLFGLASFNVDQLQGDHLEVDYASKMLNWILADTSDIKCIQEYHCNDMSDTMEVHSEIKMKGFQNRRFVYQHLGNHYHGLAIYSKFPIINSGFLEFNKFSKNNCLYIDVLVHDDTLRVYNVHLSSFTFPRFSFNSASEILDYGKSVLSRLKDGAIRHSNEIKMLIDHVESCEFPFIIAGDFNETPYGYNYRLLENRFHNAFEEAGRGFGFTYNGLVFFLRIDHQFYSKELTTSDYFVDREKFDSEHYPTFSSYSILK
jgi:endonuclease/exonuclease/phosphatase family metal-dependent hydrolase